MLSKGRNNEILAAWGEGNDTNTPVFRAFDPSYQALREDAAMVRASRYSAEIAGLEREFGRALTELPDWAGRHARPSVSA